MHATRAPADGLPRRVERALRGIALGTALLGSGCGGAASPAKPPPMPLHVEQCGGGTEASDASSHVDVVGVELENGMSKWFSLRRVTFALDRHLVYDRKDDSGVLASERKITLCHRSLSPGDHTAQVVLTFQGNGEGSLSYLRGYWFSVKSSHSFAVAVDEPPLVELTAYEKGNAMTPLEWRPTLAWRETVSPREGACTMGDGNACLGTGRIYESGRAGPPDNARAVKFYGLACDAGNIAGCSELARMLSRGLGVERDDARAAALYERACQRGVRDACSSLGWMYENGRGVSNDDARAAMLYRQACEGGDTPACSNLGSVYERGRGVTRDDAQAAGFYKKACDGGQSSGCDSAKRLVEKQQVP